MKTTSPIAAALAQLQLERDNLAARIAKVDALIVSMRDVFHLPAPPRMNGHAVKANGHARHETTDTRGISVDAIRDALRKGPMSPGALAAALDVPRTKLAYHVKKLATQGVLKSSGTTASRRYTLAEKSAKEAP